MGKLSCFRGGNVACQACTEHREFHVSYFLFAALVQLRKPSYATENNERENLTNRHRDEWTSTGYH